MDLALKTKDFRAWLNLTKKHTDFKNLYWSVIRPAYEELFENSDCWFEVAEVYKDGEAEPYKLNFKVIKGKTSKEEKELKRLHINSLYRILTEQFYFNSQQADEVLKLLDSVNYSDILWKLQDLKEYTNDPKHKIKNKIAYIIRSLKKEFVYSIAGEELLEKTQIEETE